MDEYTELTACPVIHICDLNGMSNCFVVILGTLEYLFSYKTCIAVRNFTTGNITLSAKYWDYSSTTGKHRNAFLGESKSDTAAKIKSGVYSLTSLSANTFIK